MSWPTRFPGFLLAGDRGALSILDLGSLETLLKGSLSNSGVLPTYLTYGKHGILGNESLPSALSQRLQKARC